MNCYPYSHVISKPGHMEVLILVDEAKFAYDYRPRIVLFIELAIVF